jgi:hypothetical protein
MNATRWSSLAGFVRSLGQRNICRIDENEKGWYIQWIDNSSKTLAQQEAIQKMERLKRDQEEEDRRMIEEQITRGQQAIQVKKVVSSTCNYVSVILPCSNTYYDIYNDFIVNTEAFHLLIHFV